MRKRRAGLIVNVGSLAGLTGTPGMGFYSASKHALEGYAELLRVEIERFNIRVSLVEASFFRTNLHHAISLLASLFRTMMACVRRSSGL
jgi:short-subunit dehydrogenase